ncbi:MAG TPA: ABC transporter substrate-binding protein [Stellaceae bacterium]|nr:ABC transporter substrate-binding protein [Stellaceae bacterium]
MMSGFSRWVLRGAAAAVAATVLHSVAAQAADKVHAGKAVPIAWAFIPLDVGLQHGLFAKYGIDLDISSFAGDAQLQQALASDSIDFGLGSGPAMAFVAKGAPVIAVAAFAGAPRNISLIVSADSPVKSVADMKGKLVAVTTVGSLTDWLAKRIGVQEGWGPGGLRTVALGSFSAFLAAAKTHQIDGMMAATEAGYTLEEKHQGRIIVGMEKYAPNFITHVVFARKQLVQQNPDLVRRFLKGFFASIAFMKANKAATSAVAESVLHQSPEVASKTYDYEIAMLENDGHFDPQAIDVLKQSFIDMGMLKDKPANDQLLTTQFLPVKP